MRSIAALLTGRREILHNSERLRTTCQSPPDPLENASGELVLSASDRYVFPIDDEDSNVFLVIPNPSRRPTYAALLLV